MKLEGVDLTGWKRRDEVRRRESLALLERVRSSEPLLCRVLEGHKVREAYLFGSIARGNPRPGSDVDVAVAGCAPEHFYRLSAELERALGLPLDVVDLDRAPVEFAAEVRASGRRIHP